MPKEVSPAQYVQYQNLLTIAALIEGGSFHGRRSRPELVYIAFTPESQECLTKLLSLFPDIKWDVSKHPRGWAVRIVPLT
jgi:hypothetical protein